MIIDDIADIDMEAMINAFADDSKVGMKINDISDSVKLQDSLDKVINWEESNNTEFNMDKFKLLQYGRNEDLKNEYNYKISDRCPTVYKKLLVRASLS